MAGFRSVKKYADAWDAGRSYTTHFRKIIPSTTTQGWIDLSVNGGGPPANYYAASPLEASTLDGQRGIYVGDNKSPAAKWLTSWSVTKAGATTGEVRLCDYLLFYPFVDCDDISEQSMTNTVTLPRYSGGDGVQVMAVCVNAATGGGVFTFNYINSDGDAKTSPTQNCTGTGTPGLVGSILTAPSFNAPFVQFPFCNLASGDKGVRAITSITFSAANGGLMALVLVRPLASLTVREGSAQAEQSFIEHMSSPPRIYDGAYLNIIMNASTSMSGNSTVGTLTTIWDEGT